jgi:hypothetical protein
MNLGEVRAQFVIFSGRDDLANANGSDNGADFFINSGQRFLDRRIDFRKSDGRFFEELVADSWYFKMQNCRTIETVWCNDNEERWELERKDFIWLHNEYPDLISDTDTGDPLYWTPAKLRGIDIGDIDNQGAFFNYVLAEATNEDYHGLVILPPPDVSVVIEVLGKFYSPELSADADESYWSVVVPETLLMAALYRLELFYRNTEGAKDWLAGIDLDLVDIDKDSVAEENANSDQMEG